jgi:hypothetical protein
MALVFHTQKQRDRLLRTVGRLKDRMVLGQKLVPVKHKPCAARVQEAGTIHVERAIARTSPAGL